MAKRETLAELTARMNPQPTVWRNYITLRGYYVGQAGRRRTGEKLHLLSVTHVIDTLGPIQRQHIQMGGQTWSTATCGTRSNGQHTAYISEGLDTDRITCERCLKRMGWLEAPAPAAEEPAPAAEPEAPAPAPEHVTASCPACGITQHFTRGSYGDPQWRADGLTPPAGPSEARCHVCQDKEAQAIGRSLDALVSGARLALRLEELREHVAAGIVSHSRASRFSQGYLDIYRRATDSPTGVFHLMSIKDCPEAAAILRGGLSPLSPTEPR